MGSRVDVSFYSGKIWEQPSIISQVTPQGKTFSFTSIIRQTLTKAEEILRLIHNVVDPKS